MKKGSREEKENGGRKDGEGRREDGNSCITSILLSAITLCHSAALNGLVAFLYFFGLYVVAS